MLIEINPTLPMRSKLATMDFYIIKIGFEEIKLENSDKSLRLVMDSIELQFYENPKLDPLENLGQAYIKTDKINQLYQSFLKVESSLHPLGYIKIKPWSQIEFTIIHPDNNILTFGQSI